MIGTIRKHSQTMWWVIIVAVIVTFVIWGSKTNTVDGHSGSGNYGTMNGQVITPLLFDEARRETLVYHFFAAGSFPGEGRGIPNFDVERETYNRLLVLQKAAEMGIKISDDVAAKAASERLRMLNKGNPVPLAEFEKQVLARSRDRLTLADFERYIRNELAIQQLISTVAMAGQLVTPQEIEALYRRDYQEVSVQAAFFHGASNLASIVVTPEKVGEFYTNQAARYRVPERLQLSIVRFPISNYLAQATQDFTNLNEAVENNMTELGTNYAQFGATPEAAKTKVREELLKRVAFNLAGNAAKKFDNQLYDAASKAPVTPEVFAKLAHDAQLTPEVTAPFSRSQAPVGLDVGGEFIKHVFNLTAEDPLSDLLIGENTVYVVAFNKLLPSEVPSYESIRENVTADYRFMESALKAQQQAMDFHAATTNNLATGKSFADLCAKAGVKPVSLTPFSLSTRELPEIEKQLDFSMLKRAAFETAPGQVAQVLPSADGAAVIYVQAKLPVDEAKMHTNLPEFTRSVHQVRRSEVFNDWFRREAEKAFSTLPYFQQKQAQMQGAAGK